MLDEPHVRSFAEKLKACLQHPGKCLLLLLSTSNLSPAENLLSLIWVLEDKESLRGRMGQQGSLQTREPEQPLSSGTNWLLAKIRNIESSPVPIATVRNHNLIPW